MVTILMHLTVSSYLPHLFKDHVICLFFTSGEPFRNANVVSYAASNIISGIMYGKRFEYSDPAFQKMVAEDHESIRLTGSASILVQWFCRLPPLECHV